MSKDMCVDMCIDICADMCEVIYVDMRADVSVEVSSLLNICVPLKGYQLRTAMCPTYIANTHQRLALVSGVVGLR